MANRYFAGRGAVGRSLEFEGVRREIIGVVSNMRFDVRDERAAPAAYIAYTQAPPEMLGQMWFKIRTTGEPTALIPRIRRRNPKTSNRLSSRPGPTRKPPRGVHQRPRGVAGETGQRLWDTVVVPRDGRTLRHDVDRP